MREMLLLITADPTTRTLLEAILGPMDYRLAIAGDARGGEALVAQCTPDLVLLDGALPDGQALALCQRLKATEHHRALPVMLLLGPDVAAKEAALAHGADDFLTTPLRAEDVRARIQALLHVRTIRHDLHRAVAYLRTLELGLQTRWADALKTPDSHPGHGRVLLADDDAVSREVYQALLAEQGFEVVVAETGQQALELAAQAPVDVAVLDVVMPGLSGLDVLARLRALDPTLPVILLTGHVTSHYAIAALRLGASDFIIKGQERALLLLAVDRALRQRREREAAAQEIAALRAQVQRGA